MEVFLKDLKPGDRFWFRGDWRTPEGHYTVTENDGGDIAVAEIDGYWFGNVIVEVS